jgi:catechol 2,3-dioxygenase-like lactoylglutathione lyase family enzyme
VPVSRKRTGRYAAAQQFSEEAMSEFKVLATNHTSFTVSDLDRSVAFFRDALGFEVTSRAPRDPKLIQSITGIEGADLEIAYVRGPGHSLELIEYQAPSDKGKVESRPCDTGFAHIAYDVDNIDAAVAASAPFDVLPIGDITVIDKGPNAGGRVCYLRDPDGVTIEYIEKP